MILGTLGLGNSLDFTGYKTIESLPACLGCKANSEAVIQHDTERQLLLAAYGRIDNKAELKAHLGACATDTDYILKAYMKWGKNCSAHLLGEWFLVVYDIVASEFFLARDHNSKIGVFYYATPQGLCISTAVHPLLQLSKELNYRYVIRVFSGWRYDRFEHETLFKNIASLAPGHTLTYKDNRLSIERYWYPENTPLKYYKSTQAYADELLEITREAIRCRIPPSRKVGLMLSGGFDSGTIGYLTSEVMGESTLNAFSHIPLYDKFYHTRTNKVFDESEHIDALVNARHNIRSVKLKSEGVSPIDGIEKFVRHFNVVIPNGANAFWIMDINEHADAMGLDALFTAAMGNVGLSYRGKKNLLPMAPGWKALKQKVLKPVLRNYLGYRKLMSKLDSHFLNPEVMSDYGLRTDVLFKGNGLDEVPKTIQEDMLFMIKRSDGFRLLAPDGGYGFKKTDPTADVRIIEHCFAIPNEFFFNQKGEDKQVVRQMMAGRLPDITLNENRMGFQASDIFMRLHQEIDRADAYCRRFEENPVFSYFIDTAKLRKSIALVKEHKLTDHGTMNNILTSLMLGIFLEQNGL